LASEGRRGRTLRRGSPLAWRGGLTAILPFLSFGFTSLCLALLADAALSVQAAWIGIAAFPAVADRALSDALLCGALSGGAMLRVAADVSSQETLMDVGNALIEEDKFAVLQAARRKAPRHLDTDCRRQRSEHSDGYEQGGSLGLVPMGKTICHLRSCYPGAGAIGTYTVLPGARQTEDIQHARSSHQQRTRKKGMVPAPAGRTAHLPEV
jgi:hypothetical protein